MYLNRVYYGHNAYGIGAAAETYFSKDAKDLTPAQAAFLAGLIQAPVAYDPQLHYDLARDRELYVLHGMEATGALSHSEEQKAEQEDIKSELTYNVAARQSKAPHFVDYVISRLEKDFGAAAVQQGGFNVYTTLDLDLQALAEQSVKQGVQDLSGSGVNNADFLAVKPGTGEVLAWVGSADYYNDQIGGQYDVVLRDQDLDGGRALAGGGAGHQSVLRTGIRTMTWAPPSSHPSNHAPPPTRATLSLVSVRPRCTPPLPLPEGPRPLSRTLSSTESPSLWRRRSTCEAPAWRTTLVRASCVHS